MSDLVKCLQIPFPKGENTVVDLPVWVLELAGEAAERIEALERQVKAADALIEDLLQHEGAEGFSHSTYELEAAYKAAKEGRKHNDRST